VSRRPQHHDVGGNKSEKEPVVSKPAPKWKAFGSEPVEEEEQQVASDVAEQPEVRNETVKREPQVPPVSTDASHQDMASSLPMQFKPVKAKVEPEDEIDETVKTKEEKLEAAARSSSHFKKEKVITFKKRNKEASNTRERLEDD
jgi:hypothetical protein